MSRDIPVPRYVHWKCSIQSAQPGWETECNDSLSISLAVCVSLSLSMKLDVHLQGKLAPYSKYESIACTCTSFCHQHLSDQHYNELPNCMQARQSWYEPSTTATFKHWSRHVHLFGCCLQYTCCSNSHDIYMLHSAGAADSTAIECLIGHRTKALKTNEWMVPSNRKQRDIPAGSCMCDC